VYILRYDYGSRQDQVPAVDELKLELHLSVNFGNVKVFSPGEPPQVDLRVSDEMHQLAIKNLPLYSIILLKD
jgi:hypothetical protein